MQACSCTAHHTPLRVVLTGGPGGGKTAVLELIRMAFCHHLRILPEAAGVIFGGGFPRSSQPLTLRAAQRAIYHVQHELEAMTQGENLALVLCDRGTIDGLAYWPGPTDYWTEIGTTAEVEFARYDAVIHLRTPTLDGGYNHQNPLRIETAAEAARIDARIADLWGAHPRRFEVPAHEDFLQKAYNAMAMIRTLVPPCCPSSGTLNGR